MTSGNGGGRVGKVIIPKQNHHHHHQNKSSIKSIEIITKPSVEQSNSVQLDPNQVDYRDAKEPDRCSDQVQRQTSSSR